MKSVKIKLDKVDDVQKFVTTASKYKELDLKSGRYIVSASSLMGIFSLDLSGSVKLCYPDDIEQFINKDFSKWIVLER
ncbi:MAG: HPr family phosphocarrier protein [Ruminococcus sp.]|nr:HPr family phosphocarrier protein [Ruminococcus sp.]